MKNNYILSLILIAGFFTISLSLPLSDEIEQNCLQASNGCCAPLFQSLPCIANPLTGNCFSKQKKPRCRKNENTQLIKVHDEACGGTGYLDYDCSTCKGCAVIFVYSYYDAYYKKQIYNQVKCPKCSGVGRQVHAMCKGDGWLYKCEPIKKDQKEDQ